MEAVQKLCTASTNAEYVIKLLRYAGSEDYSHQEENAMRLTWKLSELM